MSKPFKIILWVVAGISISGITFIVLPALLLAMMQHNVKTNDGNIENAMSLSDSYDMPTRQEVTFELSTKNGPVTLRTGMPKDSVRRLMGTPYTTDVNDLGYMGVIEIWEYKGRNRYVSEFRLEFNNNRLKSVHQYRE